MNISVDSFNRYDGTLIVGSRSASIYIRGRVYHLVYSATDPHRRRLTPEDASRVPWPELSRIDGVEFDANHRLTVIRIHFTERWSYRHYIFNDVRAYQSLDLVLSTRNATVRQILDERMRRVQQTAVPLAMGLHPRLGSNSAVRYLDNDTLRAVVAFL